VKVAPSPGAFKALKDAGAVLLGDADALVAQGQFRISSIRAQDNADGPAGAELDGGRQ
jgi:hypothetical protein